MDLEKVSKSKSYDIPQNNHKNNNTINSSITVKLILPIDNISQVIAPNYNYNHLSTPDNHKTTATNNE